MDDDYEDPSAVVIDNGSYTCRSGLAGDEEPRSKISSSLGKPRYEGMVGLCDKDSYVGDEAQRRRGILNMTYPIEHGMVRDWDDMEVFWNHIFTDELNMSPEELPLLMSDPPMTPKAHKETVTEIIFESLHCPAFYISLDPILSLYSSGRGSGLVYESGDGVSQIVAIYEGHMMASATRRTNLAGGTVTEYLAKMMRERFYFDPVDKDTVRGIKEKLCYAALDVDKETTLGNETSDLERVYELPDGSRISLGSERFAAVEALFEPRQILGLDILGTHDLIFDALMSCDIDTRQDLYCNIILSGGATKLQGFRERLCKELRQLIPHTMRVKTVANPDRDGYVWIGGSILASLSTFQSMWITRQEYEEHGRRIVHRKCLTGLYGDLP